MKNILVAIDFREHSKKLLNQAVQLASSFNAKVWIIHVAAPEPDFVGNEVGPQSVRDIRAEELKHEHKTIQEYANELKGKDIDAEALLIQGPTVETLLDEAKDLHTDLIIIGMHKHGFLYTTLFGNTASELIKKSGIPVLVVPLDV